MVEETPQRGTLVQAIEQGTRTLADTVQNREREGCLARGMLRMSSREGYRPLHSTLPPVQVDGQSELSEKCQWVNNQKGANFLVIGSFEERL